LSELGKQGEAADGSEGLGIVGRFFLVFGLFAATRFLAGLLEEPDHRKWLFAAVAVAVVGTRTLRKALIQTAATVLVIALVFAAVKSGGVPGFSSVAPKRFFRSAMELTVGFGPGKELVQLYAEEKRRNFDEVIGSANELLAGTSGQARMYLPFLEKINTNSDVVRKVATERVARCKGNDRLCESVFLNRFVAKEITYRQDPRRVANEIRLMDHVQSPAQTLELKAGDCEDQSILLVSLLGAVGFKTYLAFTSDHVYPLVCYERPLSDLIDDALQAHRGTDYLVGLGPEPNQPLTRRALAKVQGFEVSADKAKYCYPLEPTNEDAWIGFQHDMSEVKAILDVETGRPLRFNDHATGGGDL
jgi:hypothetical protein